MSIRAFRLFTGADEASHVEEGWLTQNVATDAASVSFAETPPHAALDWHDAPERQFVITLSGTLEFKTRDGETFVLRPGVVLVAEDTTGTGHSWRLIDDQPWRRAYIVMKPGARELFVADAAERRETRH